MEVIVQDANNIVIEVDQGRQGRGVEDVSLITVGADYYLLFAFTDGTTEQVGPIATTVTEVISAEVRNAEAVTILKGQPVYLYQAQGNLATVKLAFNTSDATSAKTLGLAAENIAPGAQGLITCQGTLGGLNTSAYNEGDTLYLGATAGTLTNVKPQAPNHLVYIGVVERANAGAGQIYVRVQNGFELDEIHDVLITNPVNGNTLIYDAATDLWKNAGITAGSGISVTNGASSITVGNTGVLSISGGTTGLTPATATTGAVTLAGTLGIANGGTGQTTANASLNALLPAQTSQSGKYLKTDGSNASWDQLDISTADITGTLPIANGGTGQTTANAGLNALLPLQTSQSGKYLKTDGTNASWDQLDISTADITGTLPVINGGTGVTTSTGTGSVVLSNSPALTTPNLGTPSAATLTNATGLPLSTGVTGTLATTNGGTGLTSFTANGVVYASSSSALTTGSALTFDGTNLGVGVNPVSYAAKLATNGNLSLATGGKLYLWDSADSSGMSIYNANNSSIWFGTYGGTELMRLTSTGLGIGTSSPGAKLDVANGTFQAVRTFLPSITDTYHQYRGTPDGTGYEHARVYSGRDATQWTYGSYLAFYTEGKNSGATDTSVERMRIDPNGNLGLGVTPSAWSSSKVLEIGAAGNAIWSFNGAAGDIRITGNAYFNGTNFIYGGSSLASQYTQNGGAHLWYTAPSGTAGNAISFTQSMTLDASGNLGIGTTSPQYKLDVTSNIAINGIGGNGYGLIGYAGATPSTGFRFSLTRQDAIAAGSIYLNSYGALGFGINKGGTGTPADAPNMLLDTSGNLGLGVTPSAWRSTYRALELGRIGSGIFANTSASTIEVLTNAFVNASNNYIYANNGFASDYYQSNGQHIWYTAPSGTAGDAISFTQAMTLDTSGNLGIGTSSPTSKLTVQEANRANSTNLGNLNVYTTTAQAADVGATIALGGMFSVSQNAPFGSIRGGKENSTDSNYNGYLAFQTIQNASVLTERMRLDSSGNLGLGVTPSAWGSSYKTIQTPAGGIGSYSTSSIAYAQNAYDSGAGTWKYMTTAAAGFYNQSLGSHAWYTAPSGTAGNAISFTQAMTLDASGNLGVGTTTAGGKLHVRTSAGAVGLILDANTSDSNSDSPVIDFRGEATQGQGCRIAAVNTNTFGRKALVFYTSDTASNTYTPAERARITSGGDLLVGNTASVQSSRAEFTSTSLVPAFLARVNVDADESQWAGQFQKKTNTNTTSQIFVRFLINDGATPSGYITANGANAATFTSTSDERLKENIADLPSQLASIQSLRPVEFDFKDGSGHQIGFIAQELQTVYPDCVSEGADGMLQIGGWSKTEARLVKAIQEQQAIIDSLKARLDAANL